jgi:kinesin family protein 16B
MLKVMHSRLLFRHYFPLSNTFCPPNSLCLVNAAPIEEPVRLSQGCVIVLGKTNMFRYNDPLEAADLRRSMTEKSRKTSLMNQSLLSQSLSDLRNPPGR